MKQCKECGIDFEPKNPKGTFCSDACRQKDYRKKIEAKRQFLLTHGPGTPNPGSGKRIDLDELQEYAVGVDPHSKEPSKAKTVVYSKKKGLKGNIPILATNPLPEAEIIDMEETVQNYKPAIILRSFRDYIDLVKTGKYDVDILRKEVQDDKKLLPAQKSMIYAKLK